MAGNNSGVENKNALTLDNIKKILDIMVLIGIPISWGWWSSLPAGVHVGLLVVIGAWILFRVLLLGKKKLVEYRESKQEEEEAPLFFFLSSEPRTGYYSKWKEFEGVKWKVEFHRAESRLDDIEGPCCPNDHTKLISNQTFLGKYKYECPACSFQKKHDYNAYTLERRVKRVVEAELNAVKEQRNRKQKEAVQNFIKPIKDGIKKTWDDA